MCIRHIHHKKCIKFYVVFSMKLGLVRLDRLTSTKFSAWAWLKSRVRMKKMSVNIFIERMTKQDTNVSQTKWFYFRGNNLSYHHTVLRNVQLFVERKNEESKENGKLKEITPALRVTKLYYQWPVSCKRILCRCGLTIWIELQHRNLYVMLVEINIPC